MIDGRLSGLVTIRYRDGAIYEGPYISEEWLDELGNIVPGALPKNHFGVYRCPEKDGRIFEGNTIHNHFDPKNLQSYYRCRLPNGEIYEVWFGVCLDYFNDWYFFIISVLVCCRECFAMRCIMELEPIIIALDQCMKVHVVSC